MTLGEISVGKKEAFLTCSSQFVISQKLKSEKCVHKVKSEQFISGLFGIARARARRPPGMMISTVWLLSLNSLIIRYTITV